ncbi:glutamine amidotransferase class-I [Salipiger mucosus DSM 16094]|uniref:Glutamine amidotransferase class-I n=1 Tax=Salipiger mucosus DSM 16094 TaxID=1123237 RepID=S9RL23_9RHOB|nr:glutamine amidotransferase class-I [Salipiger mucosus DSM 16094]
MRRFLILQLRPETEASDDEFAAFLRKGGLAPEDVHRIRLDREALPEGLNPRDYAGVIVGGGPGCVSDPPTKKSAVEARIEAACLSLMPAITKDDVPFLGCCYGIGILAHHLGAEVSKARYGEPVGHVPCVRTEAGRDDPLLADLPESFDAFVGHKEAVQDLPEGAAPAALGPLPLPDDPARAERLCDAVPPRGRRSRLRDADSHLPPPWLLRAFGSRCPDRHVPRGRGHAARAHPAEFRPALRLRRQDFRPKIFGPKMSEWPDQRDQQRR